MTKRRGIFGGYFNAIDLSSSLTVTLVDCMKKIALLLLLAVTAAAAGLSQFTPWLENRLEAALEAKGLENAEVSVSHLGFNGAAVERIQVGDESPLILKDIVINYSLAGLRSGKLDAITLKDVSLEARRENDRWTIAGLESLQSGPATKDGTFGFIPAGPGQLDRIPFDALRLEDSSIRVVSGPWQLSAPLALALKKTPSPELRYEADTLELTRGDLAVSAQAATFSAALQEDGQWRGEWALDNIRVTGAPLPLPPLQAGGTLRADPGHISIEGTVKSGDGLWHARFALDLPAEKSAMPLLRIVKAGMPWKEGRLAAENVAVQLKGDKPVKLALEVSNVSIAELMGALTGDRVSATGAISGTLPVLVKRIGEIQLLQGELKAGGPGSITMPPDVIPGDNEQVALVRQILENLQYTSLSITTSVGEDGETGVLMTLEGNNPKVYDGRPVKLNVNLTGDVLEFIQQNILLLTSPETLLKPGRSYNEED